MNVNTRSAFAKCIHSLGQQMCAPGAAASSLYCKHAGHSVQTEILLSGYVVAANGPWLHALCRLPAFSAAACSCYIELHSHTYCTFRTAEPFPHVQLAPVVALTNGKPFDKYHFHFQRPLDANGNNMYQMPRQNAERLNYNGFRHSESSRARAVGPTNPLPLRDLHPPSATLN